MKVQTESLALLTPGKYSSNSWFAGGVETPFGGYKRSGVGRENGVQAVKEYTQLKIINFHSFRQE